MFVQYVGMPRTSSSCPPPHTACHVLHIAHYNEIQRRNIVCMPVNVLRGNARSKVDDLNWRLEFNKRLKKNHECNEENTQVS